MSTSPTMKLKRERYLDLRCSELSNALVSLLPTDQRATFRGQELRKLFTEAAELATNIRLSPTSYTFNSDYVAGGPLFMGEIREMRIINEASGQPIRSLDVVKKAHDGRIGIKLCLLHPALVRKSKESGRDVTLVKATMLCNFDHPVTRRRKTKDSAGQ